MNQLSKMILTLLWVGSGCAPLWAQSFPLTTKGDQVEYQQDAKGNRMLDFSFCGYHHSEVDLPNVPVAVYVSPVDGDNSERIQRALDYVSSLKPDANGFRGAVLLTKGLYRLNKGLHITASGVVLRGADKKETVLVKQGYDRGAVVFIEGKNDLQITDTLAVQSSYVPLNAQTLQVASASKLKQGTRVLVYRPSETPWIASLHCDTFGGGISALGWKKGDIDLYWDRTLTAVDGSQITLDAPLSMALDAQEAASKVLLYRWQGRISECGVENLTMISDYDVRYPKDENHAWTGVSIDAAENCWVRNLAFQQFAGSAVIVQHGASQVTVEDCISTKPVSELGGLRRRTFFTLGQETLFQRCYSEQGIHDFAAGTAAAGPNAFVQCEAKESLGYSGSIGSWATGLLFDIVNVDGNDLVFANLGQEKNGAGWNTANSLFWQCTASEIKCYSPSAEVHNYASGCWAQFSGDGLWSQSNNHVNPRSFFHAQLTARLGTDVSARTRVLPRNTTASSSPSVEQAMLLAKQAYEPLLTLEKLINQAVFPASVATTNVKSIDKVKFAASTQVEAPKRKFGISNGWMVADEALLVGERATIRWWNGSVKYNYLPTATDHLTRFVPDMEGTGLTDRVDSVVTHMKQNHALVLDHNYGLWYDRRRDDHERIRRHDGDVWAPFYEQPFARSGEGTAWEGLSKYDLNRPNTWYWGRLEEFADKAEREGLLLFHQNYFQHNIIEAGAHWVDCPWRSANNINQTDFPEPVNFAGDKRVFVADMFYDVDHVVRRELHRQYIYQCLDNFAEHGNVVQLISEEYTGPLHFVQFWLDCIADWEQKTGKHPLIALSTTKDVQDSILNDARRAAVVDIIDIRYWHYKDDGSIYAPEGGKNLAPRQHARKMKVGKMGYKEVYKAVSEYRQRYPEKAVTFYSQNYPDYGWAVLMGGGSCAVLNITDEAFLQAVPKMQPKWEAEGFQMLQSKEGAVIYAEKSATVIPQLPEGSYALRYIDPKSGRVTLLEKKLKVTDTYQLPVGRTGAYWLQRL
jgi:hypothetical protein